MSNSYKKAIDTLMFGDVDYKAVCVQLAKTNPSLFNNCYAVVVGIPVIDKLQQKLGISESRYERMKSIWGNKIWFKQVMLLLFEFTDSPQKISAIKVVREYEKIGLRESKELVEEIQDTW